MAAVGAFLNRTITSRSVLGVTDALVAVKLDPEVLIPFKLNPEVLLAVEFDPEVLVAFGDPGMSGEILESVVDDVDDDEDDELDEVDDEDDVDDDEDDEDDEDQEDWANPAVTPAIRNRSNVFFIRENLLEQCLLCVKAQLALKSC
jgi:hypothetical protein